VRHVQLNEVEAGAQGAARRLDECIADAIPPSQSALVEPLRPAWPS